MPMLQLHNVAMFVSQENSIVASYCDKLEAIKLLNLVMLNYCNSYGVFIFSFNRFRVTKATKMKVVCIYIFV